MSKKYFKVILLLIVIFLLLPSTMVSASSIGWPIDVNADESSSDVVEETIPSDAQEEVISPTGGGLSATDEGTTTLTSSAVFPEEEYGLINRLTSGSEPSGELTEAEKIYSNYADVVPVVTTDQMVEWILRKGNEIISILQIFAQPFAIIIFIISCAICLIGSLAKGNMAGKGLIGMVASAILYAACLYAPLLVNSITGFLSS